MKIDNLKKYFFLKRGLFDAVSNKPAKILKAVDGVSLEVERGETVSLVGESGCGKSTLARTILRLHNPDAGKIFFNDEDITNLTGANLRRHRTEFQMIFQDPYSALNPRKTVRQTLEEVILVHGAKPYTQSELEIKTLGLLEQVGLGKNAIDRMPGEFSGGQRQRIGIARALAVKPSFIVCDEPVSALDVSIQAQVLNLLIDIQENYNLAFLFISHDLRVVRLISHRVAVMYLGKIVELAPTNLLYESPAHPYTDVLIRAAPVLDAKNRERDYVIEGDPPSPIDLPSGCRFSPRCRCCRDICKTEEPNLIQSGDRFVACHFPLAR
jgi:oligopeptide/dipeptide ABC transporter ATP-binding protein